MLSGKLVKKLMQDVLEKVIPSLKIKNSLHLCESTTWHCIGLNPVGDYSLFGGLLEIISLKIGPDRWLRYIKKTYVTVFAGLSFPRIIPVIINIFCWELELCSNFCRNSDFPFSFVIWMSQNYIIRSLIERVPSKGRPSLGEGELTETRRVRDRGRGIFRISNVGNFNRIRLQALLFTRFLWLTKDLT